MRAPPKVIAFASLLAILLLVTNCPNPNVPPNGRGGLRITVTNAAGSTAFGLVR
jgi:hypothetical protein